MNTFKKILSVAVMLVFALSCMPVTGAAQVAKVRLGGMPFGLKLYTDGVIVVNVDKNLSPAQRAGIKENDVILSANGETLTSNEQLHEIIENAAGEDIELSVKRDKSPISVTLTPEQSADGEYYAGMWVRDSAAGLGTMTYFDETGMSFAALGHGIVDRDTEMLMPIREGEICDAAISSVTKGRRGVAGGLNGYMRDTVIGEVTLNTDFGIYGHYTALPDTPEIEIAEKSDITTGEATVYTTVDDSGVQAYTVEISSLNLSDVSGHNMVVTVTDSALLEKTGGIVQGMSGSPIVQNGKLVGALTHVFVNSPEKGYGITAENMMMNNRTYG